MTNKEAISTLKNAAFLATNDAERDIEKAVRMAVLALEKQIPKKPTHEATLYRCNTCPTCKNVIDRIENKMRILEPFCRFCGQKIDWSDSKNDM